MKTERLIELLRTHRALVALIPLFVLFAAASPAFLSARNLTNVLLQFSIDGIMAVGMTIVMIGGGFDLAIGSVLAAAGVAAMAVLPHAGVPAAVAAGLAAGLLGGLINAALTTRVGLNPFIATLATMVTVRGAVMGVTNAQPISHFIPSFDVLGNGRWLDVPVPALVLLAVALLGHFFLARTRPGRHVFALGGNEEAARVAGVNTGWIKGLTFTICGLTAGISGVLLAARLATGSPVVGKDSALAVVSAVLLGGTSLSGGKGSIIQTMEGVVLISLLGNGMNLLKVPAYFQTLIQGLLLIAVVVLDTYSNRTGQARLRRGAGDRQITEPGPRVD